MPSTVDSSVQLVSSQIVQSASTQAAPVADSLVQTVSYSEPALDMFSILLDASLPVQLVMLVLLLLSVYSWSIIFRKFAEFRQANRQSKEFEQKFWSGGDLGKLFREVSAGRAQGKSNGQATLFSAGFKEFGRLRGLSGQTPQSVMDGSKRAMRVALMREHDSLEKSLPTLATIGSISPYIGLLGTVWGIMQAFLSIAGQSQVTLQVVGPDISEALLATAMGLFAAIPAYIAYNRFATSSDTLVSQYEAFVEEFFGILQRKSTEPAVSKSSELS